MRYIFEATSPTRGKDRPLIDTDVRLRAKLHQMNHSGDSQQMLVAEFISQLLDEGETSEFAAVCADEIADSARVIADIIRLPSREPSAPEQAAINALDPSLTPLCVSFVGMQESPSRSFGLYNIEEAIDDNLVLHSTVSLQTIAAFGYRPVMV